MAVQTTSNPKIWRRRLGDIPMAILRKIPIFQNKCSFSLNHCSVCPLAIQTRTTFQHITSRATASFELLHLDVWAAYKIDTHDGIKYFLTVVDDNSRWTWTF